MNDREGRDVAQLIQSFEQFNKSNGGDGMGVALFSPRDLEIFKAKSLTAQECAEKIAGRELGMHAMWHCRRTTTSNVSDETCHPFYVFDKSTPGRSHELVLAHNGSVHDWQKLNQLLGYNAVNDSELIALCMVSHSRKAIWDDWVTWGVLLVAERFVWDDGRVGKWHFRAMRYGRGDLRPLEFGGVVSGRCALVTGEREVPSGRWIRLFPNKPAPMLPELVYTPSPNQNWLVTDAEYEALRARYTTPKQLGRGLAKSTRNVLSLATVNEVRNVTLGMLGYRTMSAVESLNMTLAEHVNGARFWALDIFVDGIFEFSIQHPQRRPLEKMVRRVINSNSAMRADVVKSLKEGF